MDIAFLLSVLVALAIPTVAFFNSLAEYAGDVARYPRGTLLYSAACKDLAAAMGLVALHAVLDVWVLVQLYRVVVA